MSSKTKLHVFRMKEVVYTLIFLALAILFIVLLVWMFNPGKDKGDSPTSGTAAYQVSYIPGVYRSTIALGENSIDVLVTLDKDHINSVSFDSLSETVTVMYPLLNKVMDSISSQVVANQSVDVTYEEDSKYTAQVILDAIKDAISNAYE